MKLKMVEIDGSILVKNGINIDDIVIKNIVETLKSTYNGIIDGCIVTFIDDSLEIWLNGENEEFLNLNIGQDIIDKFFQGIVKADYREKSDKQAITYCFSHFIGLLADRERFINENDGDFNNRDDSKDYYDSRNCKASIIELKQQLDRELKLEKYIILKLKYSVELSRVYDFIDADLDMLFSLVISSIKKIKNNTMELIVELEDCDYLNKISIKNNNSLKIGNIISEMQDEFYRRYEIKRWIPFMKSVGESVGYDICEQLEEINKICDIDSKEYLVLQNKIVMAASETMTRLLCGLKIEIDEDTWRIFMDGLINTTEKLN